MAFRVNTNITAMSMAKTMQANIADLDTRLERLSSGVRINSAEDDAAGISITEGLRAQISGLAVGVRNAEPPSTVAVATFLGDAIRYPHRY